MIDSNKRQEQASIGNSLMRYLFFLCVCEPIGFFNGINAYYTYSCTFLLPTGYSSFAFSSWGVAFLKRFFLNMNSTQIHELSGDIPKKLDS